MKTISVFCCLLYATWTEGAKINEEGFEGGEVSFQCSYKFAWKNDKYFCKDKCKEAEDILATVKSGATAESGRITLADSGNRVFTVTFHQLQLSDSGKYWCGVDRPGFDTYTEVILTVKEVPNAVTVNETKVIPDVSPTKTYQNVSNTTQLAYNTSGPTNQSTASNSTNGGEPSMSTSIVLCVSVGGVVILAVLVLLTRFRKCRQSSKPQPQLCSNSTNSVSADERESDCEYDNIGEVQPIQKFSERTSGSRHPQQDPPIYASTEADCRISLHIYEND